MLQCHPRASSAETICANSSVVIAKQAEEQISSWAHCNFKEGKSQVKDLTWVWTSEWISTNIFPCTKALSVACRRRKVHCHCKRHCSPLTPLYHRKFLLQSMHVDWLIWCVGQFLCKRRPRRVFIIVENDRWCRHVSVAHSKCHSVRWPTLAHHP